MILSQVVDMDERKNTAEVQIFTLTANRCFWPYMSHNVFYLSCSSLLRYLPREHHPTSIPSVTDSRSPKQHGPVSLSPVAWNLFMDIRGAHHARLKDRSLAARKEERWEARDFSDNDETPMSYE